MSLRVTDLESCCWAQAYRRSREQGARNFADEAAERSPEDGRRSNPTAGNSHSCAEGEAREGTGRSELGHHLATSSVLFYFRTIAGGINKDVLDFASRVVVPLAQRGLYDRCQERLLLLR